MDLSPIFNESLAKHNVPPLRPRPFRLADLDEFLKEAYRINTHIADLTAYLSAIRPSYLSASSASAPSSSRRYHQPHAPSRRPHAPPRADSSASPAGPGAAHRPTHLTDAQRDQIDAETKALLRELNAGIAALAEAEGVRRDASRAVRLKKRRRVGLGALGRWAAGGGKGEGLDEEEEKGEEEGRDEAVGAFRDGVVWYLREKLRAAGERQSEMVGRRLGEEVERRKNELNRFVGSRGGKIDGLAANGFAGGEKRGSVDEGKATVAGTWGDDDEELSEEQMQTFARENQDMLRQYEDQLDQVRTAERSLVEISELQSTLAENLTTQQEHIDLLVQDSLMTAENVGKGNKELKRASERASTARVIFYATGAFCFTIVLWDLII
ncbi:hypothetical protein BDY21DRAFT_388439 [Lineolata rhizophorae]|uniref:t-SNARE coiled-coil homology domain-containing protein n=1 Tax=Lineolata rhizophorae TaxID=578093 RepID=A0A6A6NLW4_9PEZI|nr:hypothetical protein BDY21DRAFT_388439 [Lineolata rhizophorae]